MKQYSISLGKIFGIPITIHWTFWILFIWVAASAYMQGQSLSHVIWYFLFIICVFVCVGLHELGHALAAKRYDIKTHSITFLPIGGMANLSKIPREPRQELVIAIAGPMVNVAIALVIGSILSLSGNLTYFLQQPELLVEINGHNFLFMLFMINIILVIFNLVPAFPMDGGRVFRALLAFKLTRLQATQIAVRVGQFMAIFFVLIGLLSNPFLIAIAIFVTLGAQSELAIVKSNEVLDNYKASDIMMKKFTIFKEDQLIADAAAEIIKGQENIFLVEDDARISGYFSKNDIIKGLNLSGKNEPLKNIMKTNIHWVEGGKDANAVLDVIMKERTPVVLVGENNQLNGIVDYENIREVIDLYQSEKGFENKATSPTSLHKKWVTTASL